PNLCKTDRTPPGIPSDYREHPRLMSDLLVLAVQTDRTRIASFVFSNDGSNRRYHDLGVSEGHHDLSHHGNDPVDQRKIPNSRAGRRIERVLAAAWPHPDNRDNHPEERLMDYPAQRRERLIRLLIEEGIDALLIGSPV